MSSFRTVVIASRCRLSYKSEYLVIRKEDDTVKIHLSEIGTLLLQTQQVFISAYLMSELAKHKISLVICDEKQNPVGQYLPLYGAHNVSKRIVNQLEWTEPAKKRVWQIVVKEKIRHQACVLEKIGEDRVADVLREAEREVKSGDTTNREAHAARIYFKALFGKEFSREDESPLNAALDYGYAILLSMLNREVVARGCLTEVGICHRNEYNQFNLSCDLMEPFRPVVDWIVLTCFDGTLDSNMKIVLADLANKQVSYRGGSYKVLSVVSLYVQDCLNALNRQIDYSEIEGFDF